MLYRASKNRNEAKPTLAAVLRRRGQRVAGDVNRIKSKRWPCVSYCPTRRLTNTEMHRTRQVTN